jgi:hypothetical protein
MRVDDALDRKTQLGKSNASRKLPGATPKQSLKFNEERIVRKGQVKLVACGIPT